LSGTEDKEGLFGWEAANSLYSNVRLYGKTAYISTGISIEILLGPDKGNPRYSRIIAFLNDRADDPALFCIAWSILMAYLRIATHAGIFAHLT
jgi:hypothetical protein